MDFIKIDEFIKIVPIVTPFITLIIGAWVGNKYAIFRDRRKEMLSITVPMHEALFRQLHNSNRQQVFDMRISSDDILRLRNYYTNGTLIERMRGIGFDEAVSNYNKHGYLERPRDENGYYAAPIISDTHLNNYLNSIRKLMKYTPFR